MATYTLSEIAKHINAEFNGDATHIISGVSTLQSANEQQVSFLNNKKYQPHLKTTKAAAVILTKENAAQFAGNALIVTNPHFAFAKTASLFMNVPKLPTGIHPSVIMGENCNIDPSAKIAANVVLDDNVTIGANTQIGANCVIGNNCIIGKNCRLWPNVTLYYDTKLGDNVNIHSGTVVGADGFGWAENNGKWHKVPQLGCVIIEDNVDIGANAAIDRGAIENTIIGAGTKLDNLTQIAHNVKIGANTVVAGFTGIAGSTTVGEHCIIGGNVSIAGHLDITNNVVLTGTSAVSRSIKEPGIYSSGVGLMKNSEWRRNAVRFFYLDKMARRLKCVEKTLENLTTSNDNGDK